MSPRREKNTNTVKNPILWMFRLCSAHTVLALSARTGVRGFVMDSTKKGDGHNGCSFKCESQTLSFVAKWEPFIIKCGCSRKEEDTLIETLYSTFILFAQISVIVILL